MPSTPTPPRAGRALARLTPTGATLLVAAPAAAAGPDFVFTPLAWMLIGGLALVAVVTAAISWRRGATTRSIADDTPLGRYVPAEPSAVADNGTAAPSAASTHGVRRPGAPLDTQPLPTYADDAARPAPALQPADGLDAKLQRIVSLARGLPAPADGSAQPVATDAHTHGFLALHHVDLSIDVLRRHLAAETRPMPAVWVMLLDLCRTHSREQAFREIAAEFHQRFNVCTPAWNTYPPDRKEPGLEAYPHIVRELTQVWGTHECRRLLDRLLYDNRRGARRGFTMNAYNDLIALRRAAGVVLETIEQDFAEESKVRGAYARAAAEIEADEPPLAGTPSPLVRDLESQLDGDLAGSVGARSALEQEHPALAEALVREWGNAALASRLCEMLSRSAGGAELSAEAKEDVELLRAMAQRLAEVNRFTLAA